MTPLQWPAVFEFESERLMGATVHVAVDDKKESEAFVFGALLGRVRSEGVVECAWSMFGIVRTREHSYSRELGAPGDRNLWQLFCFACHLASQEVAISRTAWCQFEWKRPEGDPAPMESYFVAAAHKIVCEHFILSGDLEGSAARLLESGIWRDAMPDQKGGLSDDERAWKVGYLRSLYKRFYEQTGVGMAASLLPGAVRLDDAGRWGIAGPTNEGASQVDELRALRELIGRDSVGHAVLTLTVLAAVIADIVVHLLR